MSRFLYGSRAARERMIKRTIREISDSPDYSAAEARQRMIERIYRLDTDDDDIDWITTEKGTHVPIDDDGTAVGGPLKGKKFAYAKSSKNETTVKPSKAKSNSSKQSSNKKVKNLTSEKSSAIIKVRLSKQDFARFYAALGDAKKGGYIRKTGKNFVVPLHKMDDNDKPKIIISNRSYNKPKIKSVLYYESDDAMNDALERFRNGIK